MTVSCNSSMFKLAVPYPSPFTNAFECMKDIPGWFIPAISDGRVPSAALLGGGAVHVVVDIVLLFHGRQFIVFDDLFVLGKLVILLELFEKQSSTLRRWAVKQVAAFQDGELRDAVRCASGLSWELRPCRWQLTQNETSTYSVWSLAM